MGFLDYLFPVKLKDLERITIEYEKALDSHPAKVSLSFLWRNNNKPEVQRPSSSAKSKGEEDKR